MQYIVGHYTRTNSFVPCHITGSLEEAKEWALRHTKSGFTSEYNQDEKTKCYRGWARNDFVILELRDGGEDLAG